ncbi:uncharacterized protein LOC8081177 [Sorghum bicolor]|uniref:uncharacterized protein LOC8081177 n=1 Tax=Sorghum bicolor TaxID=4558 RepID=UPI00081AE93A|nr:uncharacterized protein LOC8081177 [Sorghum bicolor]XP_021308332.1 uncharacterized protein LOC8081177 [Sorghum bicolor]|eukprot:XP_002461522.2 uncharacterized protein LOC8081177 [Sorghum bicolor]
MPKHGDGAGRSAYVLVLREHEEEGRGYALELAPLLASDAAPRARGRASTRVEETAAAAATATRTGTGTGPRAHGSGQTREEAAGGAPSRDQGPRSTRESATVTSTAPRARGESPAREAGTAAAGRAPRPRGCHGRGLNTAVDVAAGGLHGGDGAGGGGEAADAISDDLAGAAGEQILRDMRTLLFSQPDGSLTQDSLRIDDANKNLKLREREVLIPVFLSPKKKGQNKDDIWNKRQIMYGIALLGLLSFVPAIVAFLPKWVLFVFAAIWGLSSIGFPFGLFGTSKLEMAYSRLMGRFIFMVFCLSVIFMLYQYMTPHNTFWTIGFAFVGAIVMAGHMISWVTGCLTGSDKDDESKSSGEQDTITSDLLQRLLDRH